MPTCREISIQFRSRKDRSAPTGLLFMLLLAFIGSEGEQLIFLNWPAESAAVLIAFEIVSGLAIQVAEKTVGIVSRIAVELEGCTVELVGSRFGHHRHDTAR